MPIYSIEVRYNNPPRYGEDTNFWYLFAGRFDFSSLVSFLPVAGTIPLFFTPIVAAGFPYYIPGTPSEWSC